MTTNNQPQIVKDPANKRMTVTRQFNAPVAEVWEAWTDNKILDQWWAPKPYKSETKIFDFNDGGYWLYAMVGPDNFKQWCKAEYSAINDQKSFQVDDMFCDEHEKRNTDFPITHWKINFNKIETGTELVVALSFDTEADMQKLIDTGFEEGFSMGLQNLEELLANSK